ncbi:MAG: FAD:protein FMN transferase [Myxococcales bacterium]|nr:FAD:protein FMN transferase [Myxococcales bacterium]
MAPPSARSLPPRARLLLPIFLALLIGLSLYRLGQPGGPGSQGAADGEGLLVFSGGAMGTSYSVKLVRAQTGAGAGIAQAALERAVVDAFEVVEQAMSSYRPDSELSRFNASRGTDAVAISKATREVFEVALQVGRASEGALDVSIGPVVDAWGFGPDAGTPAPDAGVLAQLGQRVGLDKLELTVAGLRKHHPALRCDLSAVAKGYAVDRAVEALEALGQRDFLVELGGELGARGRRPDGKPWRVAIEKPLVEQRAVQRALPLQDLGLATSGDYRNFHERSGRRLSHLIDPRRLRPVDHGLASVSVVHERVAVADAWATALSVLGPEAGPRVAEANGLMAFFIVRGADGSFTTRMTPRFASAYPEEDL